MGVQPAHPSVGAIKTAACDPGLDIMGATDGGGLYRHAQWLSKISSALFACLIVRDLPCWLAPTFIPWQMPVFITTSGAFFCVPCTYPLPVDLLTECHPTFRPNHDISPIDEEDGISFSARPQTDQQKMSAQYTLPSQQRLANGPTSNARSNLPMMRRERRQQLRDASAAANRVRSSGHDGSQDFDDDAPTSPQGLSPTSAGRIPRAMPSRERLKTPVRQERSGQYPTDKPRGQKDPRWDPVTGEIASSGNGRPSQVKPVEFARGLGISTMSSKSPVSKESTPKSTSATDPAASAFQSNRPGWRGASGRTAIVDPVQDNTAVEPLKIPPKSTRRAASPNPVGGGKSGVGGDIALASPPISPETQTPRIGGVYGGGAWQGPQTVITTASGPPPVKSSKMSNTLSALNSIRKIIPSSRSQNHPTQGYPSPPLSGSPTPAPGPGPSSAGSAPVNATTQPSDNLSSPTAPFHNTNSDTRSIRRKEIGSSHPPSTYLNPNNNNLHKPHDSFSSSVYSRPSEDHVDNQQPPPNTIRLNSKDLPTLPSTSADPYVQPPSRFSVTTYATSANTGSPRESIDADAPPLPTPPKDIIMGLQPQQPVSPAETPGESVLARARPKLRGGENRWQEEGTDEAPIKISLTKAWMSTAGANSAGINAQNSPERTRKPKDGAGPKGPRDMLAQSPGQDDNNRTGGFLGFFTSARSPTTTTPDGGSTPTSRPASILSVDKALPLAPPQEISTATTPVGTRIEQLNALLSGLGNRRININRAIEQMTKLMPQDNLMATEAVVRKREAEKRKIEELERELADIQREEHELGMKLHRAYKKLDSQTEYEPTTLWVRRAAR